MTNRRGQGGGPSVRLSDADQQDLYHHMQTKEAFWTIRQVRDLIRARYAVHYSERQVQRLLRQWGLYCYKPQPRDYRQAADASPKLYDRLSAVADVLRLWACPPERVCIGFADESSMQLQANRQRMWAFQKRLTRPVNTDRHKLNCFGFYALQGESLLTELSKGNQENLLKVLPLVRAANPTAEKIIMIWDNHPAHLTRTVEQRAQQLGIVLVNLPSYSPNLNPIERVWKQIKKDMSAQGFIDNIAQLKQLVQQRFAHHSEHLSLARSWIEDFWNPLFPKNPTPLYNTL